MFNNENLSAKLEGRSPFETSWSQTMPDAMNPSKALSENDDITEKVHSLSNLPISKTLPDISLEKRRAAVLRFLLECFNRLLDERSSKSKVLNLIYFIYKSILNWLIEIEENFEVLLDYIKLSN